LLAHRELSIEATDSGLRLPLDLGPCEGRVFMVTDRPIRDVIVNVPETAALGQQITVEIAVTDGESPIDAVVPVEVRIADPEGVEAEMTGYYGAAGGRLTIPFDFAPNDRTGVWEIRAKELASGREAAGYVRLNAKGE
ncbi:MAG TPA: hypothetical protein P5307_25640, partial [Pirellulaceae bacterium]|nr:hypothetical protein [Pirellulaceae bacterium]